MSVALEHPSIAQIKACCQALFDKKAEAITVLYMVEKSSLADFFVIATGTSEPHLRALIGTTASELKELKLPVLGTDTSIGNGWMVLDAYDFLVHVFTEEMREHYNLESLWKDAERIEIELQ